MLEALQQGCAPVLVAVLGLTGLEGEGAAGTGVVLVGAASTFGKGGADLESSEMYNAIMGASLHVPCGSRRGSADGWGMNHHRRPY